MADENYDVCLCGAALKNATLGMNYWVARYECGTWVSASRVEEPEWHRTPRCEEAEEERGQ